ncbi:MAG: hypothetical protein HQK57_07115 [Deltaproteobacteria bacterium]|nr:hypothetical protein [Deltaproteobacteria bacterium]MBF0523986.1 hypothetical protein [Deltaproteobacteria bacterium]
MKEVSLKKLLPLYGAWDISEDERSVTFRDRRADEPASHGLALVGHNIDDGSIECKVRMPTTRPSPGASVVFRANGQEKYFAAGIGGWEYAYSLFEGNNLRFTRMAGAGSNDNIVGGRDYAVKITLEGQRVVLFVDEVKVLDYRGLGRTEGAAVGLFVFKGTQEVIFSNLRVDDRRPKAFIVMQFSTPYDEVYRDAIQPLVEEMGFDPVRVDDIADPGIIISDIWTYITEASVVIAEISEANPNVYYEVGMAHSLRKPTLLLAKRGTHLPFDVRPHRCIFYDNSIPGRSRLQDSLRKSLEALLGKPIIAAAAA